MRISRTALSAAVAMLAVVQGCTCPGDGPRDPTFGELRIRVDERVDSTAEFNFGTVAMGTTAAKKLVLINTGRASLTVTGYSKPDATQSPTSAGANVTDPDAVFIVEAREVTIPVGETAEFDLTFAPPVLEEMQRDYRVTLNITADGLDPAAVTSFTLVGEAVSGQCTLPAVIDFGAVALGDSFTRTYDFVNPQPIETRAYLGPVESTQGDAIFSTSPDSPRGEFVLGSNNTRTATFTFRPTLQSEYLATVRMRRGTECPERPVRLQGIGVSQVITWAPTEVRFGNAPLQSTVEREVVFSNHSVAPVTLDLLRTADQGTSTPSNLFKVVEPAGAIVLPAAERDADGMLRPGLSTVKLSFRPTTLGPRRGTLNATTTLRAQPALVVPLHGIGGGPDIEVRPAPVLSLGRIAYFAGASPASFAQSNFRVQNVGTPAVAGDPDGNLKLGSLDGSGARGLPYWDVVARNGASRSEICVGTYDATSGRCDEEPALYDAAVGLAAGQAVTVPVRITPNGFGVREFEVRIFSSDVDEPTTTLTITANAVNVPECDLEISPIALPFGIVSPPTVKDSAFSLRNLRTGAGEVCLITNLRLGPETGAAPGAAPTFALPNGELTELELQPGETRQIGVRAWPQGQLPPTPVAVLGSVQFNVAHRTNPARQVALSTTIGNSCLTVTPGDLNFGTVQRDCSSATRTFQIYNTCTNPVTITSATFASAAGEGPGGPNCSGSAPCPEFHVVSGIAGNTVVAPGAATPVTFQLRYRPINLGPDSGAFSINVIQGGQPQAYVVSLRGNGDTQGLNTDTFRQQQQRSADILLAIDKSGSMGLEQDKLAANMNSLLQFAEDENIDFHIAAINTEIGTPAELAQSAIFNVSAGGHRFLTRQTPNLQTEFNSIVQVPLSGATESCMEPATLALTAPNINDPTKNGGFLRNEAVLAVVCVTDARDQALQPPIFYLNQLMGIKGAQRQTDFTYNVIGPFLPNDPSHCGYDDANDGRHEFMVQQTNGVKEEICLDDWSESLRRIGSRASGYRLNFFLTATPDLSSAHGIQVKLNDVDLPEIDPDPSLGSRIWEYDSTTNSIAFQPLYVPGAGDTLTVTYQVACLP